MSRTRRYLQGMSVGYAYQALTLVTGLVLTPFLLSRLGSEQYGLWLVGLQLLTWLTLLDVGVIALVPREVARSTASPEGLEATAHLVGRVARLALAQSLVVGLASLGLWVWLPAEWSALRPALGPALVAFALLYPLRLLPALLEGLQDLAWQSGANMLAWGTGTGLTVALVLGGQGALALAWGWVAQQGMAVSLAAVRVVWRHPQVLPRRLPSLRWSEAREWLQRGTWVSLNQVASALLNGADVLLVGKLLGPEATVVYACTGKAVALLIHQPRLLITAALPGLSQMRGSESSERLRQVSTSLTQATLLVSGLLATGVVAANGAFVRWWVGADKYAGLGLTVLLAVGMVLRHWCNALSMSVFCYGGERQMTLVLLADGLLAAALAALGLPWLGLVAAPLGLLAALLLVDLPGQLLALARYSGTSVRALVRPLVPWLLRTALALALATGLALAWEPNHLAGFIILGLTAVGLYGALAGPLALHPPLEAYVRPRWSALRARLPWLRREQAERPQGLP